MGRSTASPTMPTASERYLDRLCRHSFLSLWSWPHLYRDQTWGSSEGKELSDLLVVFDPHVLIFSDKYCEFPTGPDVALNWVRWYKRAILKSAKQVWGAERWITKHPTRIFLDPACTEPFPLPLPEDPVFHRIVVAHGSAEACREFFGSTPSLMLNNRVQGSAHTDTATPLFRPFTVGDIDPSKGLVHVMDDVNLDFLMRHLDTATDLVRYLAKKEDVLRGTQAISAAGEEELLAWYLSRMNTEGRHDFNIPKDPTFIAIDVGFWADYAKNPDTLARAKANTISYAWDKLIEKFTTSRLTTITSLADREAALRFMAREHRVRRRMLAKALIGILRRGDSLYRAARVVAPDEPDQPHYIFLCLPFDADEFADYSEYVKLREELLGIYCQVVRLQYPQVTDVVGIATEPFSADKRSETLAYFDGRAWSKELEEETRDLQAKCNILLETKELRGTEYEYPRAHIKAMKKGRNRNRPCHCGSGLKYKRCCGRTITR